MINITEVKITLKSLYGIKNLFSRNAPFKLNWIIKKCLLLNSTLLKYKYPRKLRNMLPIAGQTVRHHEIWLFVTDYTRVLLYPLIYGLLLFRPYKIYLQYKLAVGQYSLIPHPGLSFNRLLTKRLIYELKP